MGYSTQGAEESETAVPPAGTAVYRGEGIPEWQGNPHDRYGRLRGAVMGPDGLYVTTSSNCDGRGTCPADGDKILRIR